MKNQSHHKLATISFAIEINNKIDLWPTVSSNTDSIAANKIGRDRAAKILQYAIENQAPMILGHVTAAIIAKGEYGPAEIGFFHCIATSCMNSSHSHNVEDAEFVPVDRENRPALRLVTTS